MNAVLRGDVEWMRALVSADRAHGWKWWAIIQPEKTVGQVTMKACRDSQCGITSRLPIRTTRCGGSVAA
jgi:hypothetical protein